LDHCGALPYLTEKTHFKGDVYTTHPTKAIYRAILSDYLKKNTQVEDERLYSEVDINSSLEKIKLMHYRQGLEHNGIKFIAYNAGHVIGAAMFLVEIEGVKILYTGDYSREEDRHLYPAEFPPCDVHILIVESTYGTQPHEERKTRERRFTKAVSDIVERGGRCLLPVFALGRAQELLLILEEHWDANPQLHHIPVFYASSLVSKCMTVFDTYFNVMGAPFRKQLEVGYNPFKQLRYITTLKKQTDFPDDKPAVVMASPGMLQVGRGVSKRHRRAFRSTCSRSGARRRSTGWCSRGTRLKAPSRNRSSTGRRK
jgi:cleavage and polyadenylation specificity factor subunit 3